MESHLYLLALVPPEGIRDRVHSLKLEIKARFNAKHALKAPAHITLQMPFRRPENEEEEMIRKLELFSSGQQTFNVDLDGFDAFEPRVLFIKITDHAPIIQLHHQLNKVLIEELDFATDQIKSTLHPHMTIATRDLTEPNFEKAWPEFKERPFNESFEADSLSLLKHNGKHWERFKRFSFEARN